MCDVLITKDGIELSSVGEVARYGIKVPDHISRGSCLCAFDLGKILPSNWVPSGSPFGGFQEVGPDGKTWEDGYECIDKGTHLVRFRPDGRKPATLQEWENGEIPIPLRLLCNDRTAVWMRRQITLMTGERRHALDCSCGENLGPKDGPAYYARAVAAHYEIPLADADRLVTKSWAEAVENMHPGDTSAQIWKVNIDWYI